MAKNDQREKAEEKEQKPLGERIRREAISWLWVILIFLFIHGTLLQARVIPTGSMEQTLLVGDHLLVNRFGYDAEVPFTGWHTSLWRNPARQQMVVFRRPGQPDYVKRIIGLPGDLVEVRAGSAWVNGEILFEPYVTTGHDLREHFGPVRVPEGHYFVLGDNRTNSLDSRYWGFVPREAIVGTPFVIYLSLEAPAEAWQGGHLLARFRAYLGVVVEPGRMRWRRLFSLL
jgi:signal peptidase I